MNYEIKKVTIDDYDAIYELWNSTEQSRRALNPVDDSREGIERYLKRNPDTCFAAVKDGRIIGVILTGHDGRRAIIHHMCVHPDYRRMGIARHLVSLAEEAIQKEQECRNPHEKVVPWQEYIFDLIRRIVLTVTAGYGGERSAYALPVICILVFVIPLFKRKRYPPVRAGFSLYI